MSQDNGVAIVFHTRRYPSRDNQYSVDFHKNLKEMIAWSDDKVNTLAFSEHHATADGFMNSPLAFAAFAAGCSSRVGMAISALLLPLHDPLMVAEQLTAIDLLSGGRLRTTLGLGYRVEEFGALGINWETRGKIFTEKTEILLRLLEGEMVSCRGQDVKLTHLPHSDIRNILYMGGNSLAAARRAAKFKLHYAAAIKDDPVEDIYREECAKQGFAGITLSRESIAFCLISKNPDETWERYGSHLLYDAMCYGSWSHESRISAVESDAKSIRELREAGVYQVLTPEQAIQHFKDNEGMALNPLAGGLPLDIGWETLRLYESEVLPHIDISYDLLP